MDIARKKARIIAVALNSTKVNVRRNWHNLRYQMISEINSSNYVSSLQNELRNYEDKKDQKWRWN